MKNQLSVTGSDDIQEPPQPQPVEQQQVARKSAAREWLESLVFSLIFVFFFTNFIAQATQVPTESMKPTILVGDHFFLDKFAFPANYPQFMNKVLPTREITEGTSLLSNPRVIPRFRLLSE